MSESPTPEAYAKELEGGIFNMVVSLCMHKAQTMPMPVAKAQVADYLEYILTNLKESKNNGENE